MSFEDMYRTLLDRSSSPPSTSTKHTKFIFIILYLELKRLNQILYAISHIAYIYYRTNFVYACVLAQYSRQPKARVSTLIGVWIGIVGGGGEVRHD